MSKQVTRRDFLLVAGSAVSAAMPAACQPQVVEKIVKETVVVESDPQIVEKVVTVVAAKSIEGAPRNVFPFIHRRLGHAHSCTTAMCV